MDPSVSTVGSYLEAKGQTAFDMPAAEQAADTATLDPILVLAFGAVFLAICWQNWVLARRAEGRSLIPDWVSALRSD